MCDLYTVDRKRGFVACEWNFYVSLDVKGVRIIANNSRLTGSYQDSCDMRQKCAVDHFGGFCCFTFPFFLLLIFHTINFLMSVHLQPKKLLFESFFRKRNEVWGVIINGQKKQKTNFRIII